MSVVRNRERRGVAWQGGVCWESYGGVGAGLLEVGTVKRGLASCLETREQGLCA